MESSSEVNSSVKTVLDMSDSPESKTSITLQFEHPVSVWQSHFDGSLNLVKSVFIGTKPNLWAKPSSGKTEEFSKMSTVSIAKTELHLDKVFAKHLHTVMGCLLALLTFYSHLLK